MTRRGKIILVSVLGASGLVVLIYGGIGLFLVTFLGEIPKAVAGADAFLDRVASGRVDEAYDSASPLFRSSVTPEKFREIVAKYPALGKPTGRAMTGARVFQAGGGTQAAIQYQLSGAANSLSVTFSLVPSEGGWKVQGIGGLP